MIIFCESSLTQNVQHPPKMSSIRIICCHHIFDLVPFIAFEHTSMGLVKTCDYAWSSFCRYLRLFLLNLFGINLPPCRLSSASKILPKQFGLSNGLSLIFFLFLSNHQPTLTSMKAREDAFTQSVSLF